MEIAGVVKFKHGGLWRALQALGWSQSELARRSGFCPTTIGQIINMKTRPTEGTAHLIEIALGNAGQYVDLLGEWPDTFRMGENPELSIYREICRDQLLNSQSMGELERRELMEDALSLLEPQEREILTLRHVDGKSIKEIAERGNGSIYDVTRTLRYSPLKVKFQVNKRLLEEAVAVAHE